MVKGQLIRNVRNEAEYLSLSPSSSKPLTSLSLLEYRTLRLTVRLTFDGSATDGARINFYYSPDGKFYDTIPYAYEDITLDAGNTVQRTINIDADAVGYLKIELENLDSSHSISNIKSFTSYVSFDTYNSVERIKENSEFIERKSVESEVLE